MKLKSNSLSNLYIKYITICIKYFHIKWHVRRQLIQKRKLLIRKRVFEEGEPATEDGTANTKADSPKKHFSKENLYNF